MMSFRPLSATLLAAALATATLAVARAESGDVPLPKPAPACERGKFRVVLDVGHTAEDPGARSARGHGEYAFNLRLARRIDGALTNAGFDKTVLMVTGGPSKRSLYARMARANAMAPDLLLSIHHDSVPEKFKLKWEFNGKPEIYSDRFKGHSIFVSNNNVRQRDSLAFASLLGNQLADRGLTYTPHYVESFMGKYRRTLLDEKAGVYRYDTLFVLKKSRVPAVLLEAGSIVNRDEELALGTPERQAQIAAAVVDAVDKFCVAQAIASPQAPHIAQSAKRARRPHRRQAPQAKAVAPASAWRVSGTD